MISAVTMLLYFQKDNIFLSVLMILFLKNGISFKFCHGHKSIPYIISHADRKIALLVLNFMWACSFPKTAINACQHSASQTVTGLTHYQTVVA